MELELSEQAKRRIKGKLSQLWGAGGLLINFVEYKSCCGTHVKISSALVVDIKRYGTTVVPVAAAEGVVAYARKILIF